MTDPRQFAPRLLAWFDRHGRHDLPWQHPRTPYRAWVAEIMLQQTQVATVVPYFLRFVERFPDLHALATADTDDVLAHWSGLGYYARARNLQRCAQLCDERHAGLLPTTIDELAALPGIGRSTAAAILSQAHGARHAILDGNVKRLLCRLFGIEGWPGSPAVERQLWPLAESLLPDARLTDYTQAQMDFGATLCTRSRPTCAICPFGGDCRARIAGRVAELPSPRPAKTLPQRDCVMLLLTDAGGRVLLQRRPPTGVWAGLWSLPQFDDRDAAQAWAEECVGPTPLEPMPPVDHTFSHYRLRIQPLRGSALGLPRRVRDNDDTRSIDVEQLGSIGLPAPVRRLLASVLVDATS